MDPRAANVARGRARGSASTAAAYEKALARKRKADAQLAEYGMAPIVRADSADPPITRSQFERFAAETDLKLQKLLDRTDAFLARIKG